jgi:hypothetical protein
MRTGFGAVDKAAEDAKARSSQGFSGKLNYLTIKDGETKVVRFLTDDVLTCLFYEYVVNNQGRWTDFIVPTDLDPSNTDWVKEYGGYQLENTMSGPRVPLSTKERSVGLCVLKEEHPREVDGKTVIGYRDVLDEVTVDGRQLPSRWFGVIKQSAQLFWTQMSGYHHEFGTICDRDYKIRRIGSKFDTTYQIIPRDPDPDFDILAFQESYGYGHPRPKDDPERFLYCPMTLPQWAEDYASESRVKYWLGDSVKGQAQAQSTAAAPNVGVPVERSNGLDEFHRDTTQNPADEAQAAPAPAATDFSSLRARLERHTP